MSCYICNGNEKLQDHHIIPQCLGGTNSNGGKIQLCHWCHKVVDRNGPYKQEHIADILKGGDKMLMLILLRVNAHVEQMKTERTIERNFEDIVSERAIVCIERQIAKLADEFIENPTNEHLLYLLKTAVKALRKYKATKLSTLEEKFHEQREEIRCEDAAEQSSGTEQLVGSNSANEGNQNAP